MNLEDYVKKEEQVIMEKELRKRQAPPEWVRFYKDTEDYSITPEKLELIKEFSKYISSYDFNTLPLPERSAGISYFGSFTLQQIKTQNNKTMCALIAKPVIQTKRWKYKLNEQEYNKRINYYQKVGSQSFYMLNMEFLNPNERLFTFGIDGDWMYYAVYSEDGHIFLSEELASEIERCDINTLGRFIAKDVVAIKQKKYPN